MKDNIRPDLLDRVFNFNTVEDVAPEESDLIPDSLNIGAIAPVNSGNGPPLRQRELSQLGAEKTTDAGDKAVSHPAQPLGPPLGLVDHCYHELSQRGKPAEDFVGG